MKNFQQNSMKRAGMIGMVCLLAGLLSSCLKDKNNNVELPLAALITVINASPDSQPLDFLLDQNMANPAPIRYGHILDYTRAYTGKRVASFYVSGSQQKIIADTINLDANKYYSLFLSNSVSTPDVTLLTDTLSKPASGMAVIRFINLSTNAGAVDLDIQGGAVLASNKAYKSFTAFMPVEGGKSMNLEIKQAGTSTVLVSLSNITLQSGAIYTIWLHGLTGATDQTKLALDIQRNGFY